MIVRASKGEQWVETKNSIMRSGNANRIHTDGNIRVMDGKKQELMMQEPFTAPHS